MGHSRHRRYTRGPSPGCSAPGFGIMPLKLFRWRFGGLRFLCARLFSRDALGFLVGDYVEAHEVGGTGKLAGAGDYAEHVSGLQQAAADQVLLGHGDHLFGGMRLAAAHGMHSPVEIHAADYWFRMSEGVERDFGAVFGNHAGGVARLGEDGNCAHGQVFGGVRDGFADGFGDGESAVLAAAAVLDEVSHVAFGFDDDARHDGDGFAGILAASGFSGEHDGVGAVEDGVGYVAGFGARGARVFDHRLEHLRSGDYRLAPGGGTADYVLLNDGDFFRGHFYAEVAAGDHDSVGCFENFFQMIDGLRLFQFRDYGDVAVVLGDDLFDHDDVGGGADEGNRNRVDAVGQAEFQVLAIFFCESGD